MYLGSDEINKVSKFQHSESLSLRYTYVFLTR